jgi:hypothetical protein
MAQEITNIMRSLHTGIEVNQPDLSVCQHVSSAKLLEEIYIKF